jgi:hypothetical protein
MLSPAQLKQAGRRRSLPSLRQQYLEYRMQRIESYKKSIPRGEVLAFGGEATVELEAEAAGQFVLTEVLLCETVDRLIAKRLRLPSYKRWRKQYGELRQAQREPGHWGIEAGSALVTLLPCLEVEDNVLVIGAGAHPEACLLAAFDAEVTFVDGDLRVVQNLESRMDGESLSGRFNAYVASLGEWLPPLARELDLVVIDAVTLSSLSQGLRRSLFAQLRHLTREEGVHVILPGGGGTAPEGYLSHYPDWDREPLGPSRKGKASRSRGVIVRRPSARTVTPHP